MIIAAVRSLAALLLFQTAFAQRFRFEVASVRPASADRDVPTFLRGGPGTSDPERITYQRVTFERVLYAVYGLDFDQVSGPPWIGTELYTISAKLPQGTTKEQLKLMWQDLLAERFHFQSHFTRKDFPAYELSVAGSAPKLRESGEGPAKEQPGFPVPQKGRKWAFSVAPPRTVRFTFRNASMADFIHQLAWPLSTMVRGNELALGRLIDKTGLEKTYDFTFEFAGFRGPAVHFLPRCRKAKPTPRQASSTRCGRSSA